MAESNKNTHGGAGRGQGNFSKYGDKGAKPKLFSLPADPEKFNQAAAEIKELLKKYHVK